MSELIQFHNSHIPFFTYKEALEHLLKFGVRQTNQGLRKHVCVNKYYLFRKNKLSLQMDALIHRSVLEKFIDIENSIKVNTLIHRSVLEKFIDIENSIKVKCKYCEKRDYERNMNNCNWYITDLIEKVKDDDVIICNECNNKASELKFKMWEYLDCRRLISSIERKCRKGLLK